MIFLLGELKGIDVNQRGIIVKIEKTTNHDLGSMATIGRSRAVAWLYTRFQTSGFFAWLVWLVFHFITLIGFRNRLNVFVNWVWIYLTYDRSVRILLEKSKPSE